MGIITSQNAIAVDENLINPGEILGTGMESLVINDLAEWLLESNDPNAYTPPPGVNVDDFIKNFDLGNYVSAENVKDVLVGLWLDDIYSSSHYKTQPNIAQFLLDNNLCPENWVEEVQSVLGAKIETNNQKKTMGNLSL